MTNVTEPREKLTDDEEHIYYTECITSLNSAWQIILKVQEDAGGGLLTNAAYRMALIDYAKPFKRSRGTIKRSYVWRVPPDVSESDKQLHEQIILLRDQFLAHSDISIKDARVYKGDLPGLPPLIISNTDPQLPKPDSVRRLIEYLLNYLYSRGKL